MKQLERGNMRETGNNRVVQPYKGHDLHIIRNRGGGGAMVMLIIVIIVLIAMIGVCVWAASMYKQLNQKSADAGAAAAPPAPAAPASGTTELATAERKENAA